MRKIQSDKKALEGYFTLAGDVNSDMVRRVFDSVAAMTVNGITTAHILVQSNGGFVSDGICLYNYLSRGPIEFITYNSGAVASIAVTVFLAGTRRLASDTARFMLHKSHASPAAGTRPNALKIIVDGLMADDLRTEKILKKHIRLSRAQWDLHAHSDLHLTAEQAIEVGMIHEIGDFAPPSGAKVVNI